jgi:hypothetical protein
MHDAIKVVLIFIGFLVGLVGLFVISAIVVFYVLMPIVDWLKP